jgi:hypothetical protein
MLKSQQSSRKVIVKNVKLSNEIEDPMAIPYFLWDEPMNVAQLKDRLHGASRPERVAQIVSDKPVIGIVAVDPPEEILANKLCALLGRAEIRDLVDVRALELS